MRSLRARLWLLWLLTLLASAGVAVLMAGLYRTSSTAQLQRAEAVAARSCGLIGERFAFYAAGSLAPPALQPGAELTPVVTAALAYAPGVGGGMWSAATGPLAAVIPPGEEGLGLPDLPVLGEVSADAASAEATMLRRVTTESGTLVLAACPIGAAESGVTAWTAAHVHAAGGFDRLRAGLALLGALVLLIAGGVTWLTASWGRQVRRIEQALQGRDVEALPRLPATGERELDRIVAALNAAGERMAQGRTRAADLAGQVAAAEHLAALGRVAAGVAHEIRNPMGAMRLRLENALAGDPARLRPALEASLVQIGRVDRLVGEMLAVTQRRTPVMERVDVPAFLGERVAALRERAPGLLLDAPPGEARFDPELIGRAVDNLLLNAIQHSPAGGRIILTAEATPGWLRIGVADSGPGVDPALRPRLFEPFATGRPDGTGLGLAIAREMVEAHGGRVRLEAAPGGAVFLLELPQ